MDTNNARFAPALNAKQRQELMREFNVARPEVVDSFLRHVPTIEAGRNNLRQLKNNCPEHFKRRISQ